MSYKLLFIILLLLAFFDFSLFMPTKSSMIDYPLLLVLATLTVSHIQVKEKYSKLIFIYLIFVLISCLNSHYVHNQRLYMVVAHSFSYISILFYYYLKDSNMSYRIVEKVLITLSIICCSCYLIQWIIYPIIILFNGASGHMADLDTDYYRVRIPGSICCYCLLLYGINKYLQDNKIKFLFLSLLGYLPIIIQGFRTLTFLSAVSVLIMIPFVTRRFSKTISFTFVFGILAFFVFLLPITQSKIAEMMDRQESGQTFSDEDYIRIQSYLYYTDVQFTDPLERVLGGGQPTDPKTDYFDEIYHCAYEHGFYWNDLGLIGLSWIIGIPAVCLLIAIYILCIYKMKWQQLQYLRFTLFLVLLGSFTTAELFRDGNVLILSLFIYIEYKCRKEEEMQMLNGTTK